MSANPHNLDALGYHPGAVLTIRVQDVPGCWASLAPWCEDCKAQAVKAIMAATITTPAIVLHVERN